MSTTQTLQSAQSQALANADRVVLFKMAHLVERCRHRD